jgi:hypothetical protein
MQFGFQDDTPAGSPGSDPVTGRRRVAMGDPQAPFERVQAVLARHQLLDRHGRLLPDVELTSMGDHFDWGGPHERERAAADGLALLTWLASHPAEQVHLVLGNHDLARVGELAGFDDTSFEAALGDALPAYAATRAGDPDADRLFRSRWPQVPSAEYLARDFVTFRVEQRLRVEDLLRSRRFRVAFAPAHDLLLLHAGVTLDDLAGLGLEPTEQRDAVRVAEALNAALDKAILAWTGGPLELGALHRPGSAERGAGGGIFCHRPALPELGCPEAFVGAGRRRFDPRRLPSGLTQAIGHIQDAKCRSLLDGWCDGAPAGDGPLRCLRVEGGRGWYRAGVAVLDGAGAARVVFTDGAMAKAPVDAFQLLDVDRIAALAIPDTG